ncbi:MAG: DUF2336 domain-containing protein [Rhodospirillaceae bacterium]
MSTISLPPEGRLGYKEAKELARHPDARLRLSLAGRRDVPPEILYYLADDPDPDVRRAIVANQSTPALAHLVLVDDMDEGVRAGLAERIVRLAPGLNADERDRARQTAYRVLERLAEDQIPRVRQILSEALKDVADAPADVINRLARDVEEAVSAPVLEFSPVLRDEDLLDIIGENPTTATLSAISRRARVGADVADAIAATDDANAIAVLLANASAQIREETLDQLIERAEACPIWHEPLVHRPDLRQDAAVRLAHFVADRLIQALIERQDLSEETLREVRRVVHRRLEDDGAGPVPMQRGPKDVGGRADGWMNGLIAAYERALRMAENGLLDETAVVEGIKAGDSSFVIAALAAKGGLSPALAQAAVQSSSGRAIAAVVWKAGLSPVVSAHVQIHLAGIPPGDVVGGIEGTGFGLTDSEMLWQIEMFGQIAAEEAT